MVPVEGIEPPLLAEHDFESCASTSSATRARRMIRKRSSRMRSGTGRVSGNGMRQEAPLYIRALAASMDATQLSPAGRRDCMEAGRIIINMRLALASARRTGKLP